MTYHSPAVLAESLEATEHCQRLVLQPPLRFGAMSGASDLVLGCLLVLRSAVGGLGAEASDGLSGLSNSWRTGSRLIGPK